MNKAVYSDLNLDFTANPFTGDIIKATNAEAIKKAFRNLILTNFYEVPFNPSLGSNIRASLFENFNPLTIEFMKTKIREMTEQYEPRVKILNIDVNMQQDQNGLEVNISYTIVQMNRNDALTVFLGRTR